MNAVISSPCPNCGANLPPDQMAGIKIFKCPYCGQAIHPANCVCSEHNPDLAVDYQEARMGMSFLDEMKRIQREDQAERARLGLSQEPQPKNEPIVIRISGSTATAGEQKACRACGALNRLDAKFCKQCGTPFNNR